MDPFEKVTTDPLVRKVVKALSAPHEAESPRARQAKNLLSTGDLGKLLELSLVPSTFDNALDYLECVAIRDFLRKVEVPAPLAKARAEETFTDCEAQCFVSNHRLSQLPDSGKLRRVIETARRRCQKVLGKVPSELIGRHGPGTAYGLLSAASTAADKMQLPPTRTADADIILPFWRESAWGRGIVSRFGSDQESVVVRGNRFTVVPKDLRKMRGICVEPSLNVFYQLGVGSVVRRRLAQVGIDLNDGQALHRELAARASILGDRATIDLSNASDTICVELVRLLIPEDWFQLFDSLRSRWTQFKGDWHFLEKFSSMGNGYTFELESLLFWALTSSALEIFHEKESDKQVFVYGDDIIVPTYGFASCLATLNAVGLTVNSEKTFSDGPFRESCGGDFFWGADVRPFFLKSLPTSPETIFRLANGLRGLLTKFPDAHPFRGRIELARLRALEALPTHIRSCRGPEELGDICIHEDDYDQYARIKNSIRSFRVYRPASTRTVSWGHYDPSTVLACALLGVGDGLKGITPRNSVTGYKLGWANYS